MRVAITGTPGTGKSTVSRLVAKMAGYPLVDVNKFAKKHGLFIRKDKKRGSWIVDEKALEKELSKLKGNVIIEGHLAHYSRPSIAIVLRLEPEELEKRLERRKWIKEKIRENVEAEAVGVCLAEAMESCKKVFEIDTTGHAPEEVAKEIVEIIHGKNLGKYGPGKVDWLGLFFSSPAIGVMDSLKTSRLHLTSLRSFEVLLALLGDAPSFRASPEETPGKRKTRRCWIVY